MDMHRGNMRRGVVMVIRGVVRIPDWTMIWNWHRMHRRPMEDLVQILLRRRQVDYHRNHLQYKSKMELVEASLAFGATTTATTTTSDALSRMPSSLQEEDDEDDDEER